MGEEEEGKERAGNEQDGKQRWMKEDVKSSTSWKHAREYRRRPLFRMGRTPGRCQEILGMMAVTMPTPASLQLCVRPQTFHPEAQ